jgi:hypothetical protein
LHQAWAEIRSTGFLPRSDANNGIATERDDFLRARRAVTR